MYPIYWYQYPKAVEYQYTFGTGTTLTGTGTNMQSLRDLSRISILVQGHARLLTTTSRSLMRIVFKAISGESRGDWILGFGFIQFECFLSYF